MCNMKPLTPDEFEEEMENPDFCVCCESVCLGGNVKDHCCNACRGD